jgi:hypothetical protein
MIKKIYSVYDKKAAVYCTPFYSVNAATAVRDFGHVAKDSQTEIGKYPEDFSLWYFGEWDDQEPKFNLQEPVHIANAIDFSLGDSQ